MGNKMQEEKIDVSNLLLLAEVCWEESEKIHRPQGIFGWFSRKKRTTSNAMKNSSSVKKLSKYSRNKYEEKIATAVAETSRENEKKIGKTRRWADDEQQHQEHRSLHRPSIKSNNKKKIVIKKKMKVEKPTSIPTWVEQLARTHLQNPQPAIWVCDKVITKSDTDDHLKRFFIPRACFSDNLLSALTPQEQGQLEGGIAVKGLDGRGRLWNLQLKYWPSINMHVLQKEWIKLAEMNVFEAEKDTVQVWLCRCQGDEGQEQQERLCFVIGRKLVEGDCQC